MGKQLIERLQQTVIGSALILGAASVTSRFLGLFRDRLISSHFGIGHISDSYFSAFRIPDFIYNILVLGALSASFVPIFIEYRKKDGERAAMDIANDVLNILTFSLVVLAAICFIFAPSIVHILGYGDSGEERVLITHFTRIMLLSMIFFGMSNVLAGVLHANKRFFVYAMAPIMYNVGIIIGILVLYPIIGVTGLPWGVVFGAALHFLVQLPAAMKTGFRFRPHLSLRHPGVRRILMLMPSRSFALGLTQVNLFIIFIIASTLSDGAKSVWQYADNLQHFPINIFGVSLSLAVFPLFSEAFAENNIHRFKQIFSENFRRILFFIIPISIATLLLRAQIVRLVYGAGVFDWTATKLTAQTLGMFALSMFAQSLIPLLARAFFARQDTMTPVVISLGSVVVNLVLGWWFAHLWGIIGLALAFSIAEIIEMLTLLVTLRARHGDLEDNHIISSTWKIIISSLGMGCIIQGLKYVIAPAVDMHTFVGIFLQTMGSLIGGGMMYLFIATQFHFDEAEAVKTKIVGMWSLLKRYW
ncbi:MAG: murein biosynthesis integral membrane protein MurJ [Candidatus Kerfeldbacteria bacterium]|nr:murein biosynthesis integral membrane protein MurJ [Candidatus Kerfeldbacteria bacterium]